MTTILYGRTNPPSPSLPPQHDLEVEVEGEGVSDGELLERFIRTQDDCAFAEIVRRHGSMVLGVCQRILHNRHDAEDCFQAAFMVLVRKATSICPREMVGNWLYGVAYRTALEARKMAARRRSVERKKQSMPASEATGNPWQDLQPVLDLELARLPDRYRAVLILCDLEGKTRKEAAQQLNLPEGTIASRLNRARALLAKRLTRYSLTFSATTLAVLLTEHAAVAHVSSELADSTIAAASELAAGEAATDLLSGHVATLTETVVNTLQVTRTKIATAALLVLAFLGIGLAALLPSAIAGLRSEPADPPTHKPVDKPNKFKREFQKGCVVEKLDPANHTLHASRATLSAGGSPQFYDLEVTPATRIIIDGKEGNFADLRAGVIVDLEFQGIAPGKHRAVRIEAIGPTVVGIIQVVHDGDGRVTIRTEDEKSGQFIEKTYDLLRNAWVLLHGKKAKLSDLKSGMKVKLQLSAVRQGVVGIEAAGPRVDAVVKGVDRKKQTMSVSIKNTHLVAENIALADDVVVFIDEKRGTLADVPIGSRVQLLMSAETERSLVVGITIGPVMKND